MTLEDLPPDTPEQALITNFKGNLLVVKAYAGTGKTSTLVKFALKNPTERMLYVAFNRAIRDEAMTKFPSNVECKTSHQMAFASIGKKYRSKLKNNLRLTDIYNAIDSKCWSLTKSVLKSLNNFMASPDNRILDSHFDGGLGKGQVATRKQAEYRATVLDSVNLIWNKMIDVNDPFPMIHDGYLKLYQLSGPNLAKLYKAILFDEAQDSNPVTNSIVTEQDCKVIFVGDDHQQIYRFRGASNALDAIALQKAETLKLTNSFRFGQQVATVANSLLLQKNERTPVVGRGGEDRVLLSMPSHTEKYTVLCRSVAGVISAAIEALSKGKTLYWVGGVDSYPFSDLEDLYWLSKTDHKRVKNKKMLKDFKSIQNYISVAEETQDPEMTRGISLLKNHGDIPDLIRNISLYTTDNPDDADVILSTAHKCKGLEWDNVVLFDDFPDIFNPKMDELVRNDEINLLYVAATRAMKCLAINTPIKKSLDKARAMALKEAEPAVSL